MFWIALIVNKTCGQLYCLFFNFRWSNKVWLILGITKDRCLTKIVFEHRLTWYKALHACSGSKYVSEVKIVSDSIISVSFLTSLFIFRLTWICLRENYQFHTHKHQDHHFLVLFYKNWIYIVWILYKFEETFLTSQPF